MHRISILVFCQAIFSLLQVYFISKISLIGKMGIAMFHKEYELLRSGWKTFLLFFGIQLTIILVLWIMKKRSSRKATSYTAYALLVMALLGLWSSYSDFQYTYSHRLLKERFHLGFYLFWIGWMSTCIFFLIEVARDKPEEVLPPQPIQEEITL